MRVSWFPHEEEALLSLFLEARNNPMFYTGKQIRAEGWEWIFQEMGAHCVDPKPKSAMQFKVQQLMREYEYFDYLRSLDGAEVVGNGRIQLDDELWSQVMQEKPTQVKFFRKIRSCGVRHVELCSLIGKRGRIHTNSSNNTTPTMQQTKKKSKPTTSKATRATAKQKSIKKVIPAAPEPPLEEEEQEQEEEQERPITPMIARAASRVFRVQDETDVENRPVQIAEFSPREGVGATKPTWSVPASPSVHFPGVSSPSLPSSPSSCCSMPSSPSSCSTMSSPASSPHSSHQRPSKRTRMQDAALLLNTEEDLLRGAQVLGSINSARIHFHLREETEDNINKFLLVATTFLQRKMANDVVDRRGHLAAERRR